MAVLSAANPTLLDLAKRLDPDNKIAPVVELLNETNEILTDMTWLEGNLLTGHRTTVRTGIPEPTWRKMYGGVQPNKSTTAQVTDDTGMLEAYAEVDKALADLNGNTAEFRLSEDRPHIEGMNQTISDTIFYGNGGLIPESFTGLSPRFNSRNAAIANSENVIHGGGAGTDNGSIWLIVWGPNTVHGIVPKGSKAGLQVKDLGEVTIENADGAGGRMQAYRTHYRWDAGLTVRDWRYVVRIANIDKSDLTTTGDTGANLPDLMFEAIERIPNLSLGRAAFYMSRGMRTKVRQQSAKAVRNSTLTIEQVGGVPVMSFHGIPIRRVDSLAADEALVPA
jgi:hypothetical protein